MISKLQEENLRKEKEFKKKRKQEKKEVEIRILDLSKKFKILVAIPEYEWFKQELIKTRDIIREQGEQSATIFKDQFTYTIFKAENDAVIRFINNLLDTPKNIIDVAEKIERK